MHLLVENRLSDFHSELELLSQENKASTFVQFPIQLEQLIMEGAYSKVLELSSHQPSIYYSHFVAKLMETVR
jgi:26S proteasome regulatory subunit N12